MKVWWVVPFGIEAVSTRDLELAARCTSAYAQGADFPTIWKQMLHNHPLVVGLPIQRDKKEGPFLEIPLVNGQRLLFDRRGFSIG
jgi:hypothetical protein